MPITAEEIDAEEETEIAYLHLHLNDRFNWIFLELKSLLTL